MTETLQTEQIIACAFKVSNTLGCGFLEKVYENALAHELNKSGLPCEQQASIDVRYDGVIVGQYFADILVDRQVILEIKVVKNIIGVHEAQTLNYLKATGLKTALVLNFASSRVEVRRFVL